MSKILEELQERRRQSRVAADALLTRASEEERDLNSDELEEYRGHVDAEREAGEEIEQRHEEELREVRAAGTREPTEEEPYPLGAWLTRAITGASGAGAAFTPSEFPATFFDKLSAASVLLRSGVQVVSTERDSVVFPRWVSDTTAAWVAEAGTITSTDAVGDTVTATPRKLAGLQRISNETLADSNPSLFEVVANGLVRSIALKADLGFFEGSGTPPEITGFTNLVGRQTLAAFGTPADLDKIAQMLALLEAENASAGAIVMAPATWAAFATLKEAPTGSNKPLLQESAGSGGQAVDRRIYGVPVYLSSQLATTRIYAYDPSQVVVVQRADVSVELDRSRLFNSDESEIRAIARLDLIVPNPKAVVVATGVT